MYQGKKIKKEMNEKQVFQLLSFISTNTDITKRKQTTAQQRDNISTIQSTLKRKATIRTKNNTIRKEIVGYINKS